MRTWTCRSKRLFLGKAIFTVLTMFGIGARELIEESHLSRNQLSYEIKSRSATSYMELTPWFPPF